ncbi:hypothetical protein [Streptomyces werraensis]|uniref:hypothetical protein n=1 Tax=Streptomyces werraensis TaxID=68284 RepID=UPI00380FF2B8
MPAGTTVDHYGSREARISAWCSGLFGLTGKGVTEIPLKSSWLTMSLTLRWTHDGWKLFGMTQQDGPVPADANAQFGSAPQL